MTASYRLMFALGLACASLVVVDPAPAAACGSYVMNPEDQVLGLAWQALADEPGARVEALRWQDDGSVEVEVRWATYRPGTETAQYLYYAIDDRGGWAMTSHSFRFTLWRDTSADARKPTPRLVPGPRKARVARR